MRNRIGSVALDSDRVVTISEQSGHDVVVQFIQLPRVLVDWSQVRLIASAVMRALAGTVSLDSISCGVLGTISVQCNQGWFKFRFNEKPLKIFFMFSCFPFSSTILFLQADSKCKVTLQN